MQRRTPSALNSLDPRLAKRYAGDKSARCRKYRASFPLYFTRTWKPEIKLAHAERRVKARVAQDSRDTWLECFGKAQLPESYQSSSDTDVREVSDAKSWATDVLDKG